MTNDELKAFFHNRPAISKTKVAEEAGIGARTLVYYLEDDPRPITKDSRRKLKPVLMKYGWKAG